MTKIKLVKKPKKEEIEKDGRGNTIPPAGIGKYKTSRQKK
jgi:hypothetical protein